MKRSRSTFLLLIVSLLLLCGQIGLVTHGYSHLHDEIAHSQRHDGALLHDACLICYAYHTLGSGTGSRAAPGHGATMAEILVAVVLSGLLFHRIRLVFRSRAPPLHP